jgi:threonine dehydrogenase-like Zn-dependent dehydrogenase
MCLNGQYTERGIKGRHGYLAEYYAELPKYLVAVPDSLAKVGMLVEPTSIAAKAIEQIWRIQQRMAWAPRRAVVTGAGPVGLLAAAALRLRDLDVYVYDRAAGGPKVDLVGQLGATYLTADDHKLGRPLVDELGHIDIAIEATGYSPLAFDLADTVGTNGVVVLTGVSGGNREAQIAVDHFNLEMVLANKVIVGTVNANRRHFEAAVADLEGIERSWPGWLEGCISRRVAHADYRAGLERGPDDVKVVVQVRS